MTQAVSNINASISTFYHLIEKSNEHSALFTTRAVTVSANSSGDVAIGNSTIQGSFGANTIFVKDTLRGGDLLNSANLNITSNVIFTGSSISISSLVNITNNTNITASNVNIANGIFNISSNVNITGSTIGLGNAKFTSNLIPNSTQQIGNNTNMWSNLYTTNGNILALNSNTITANSADIISINSNTIVTKTSISAFSNNVVIGSNSMPFNIIYGNSIISNTVNTSSIISNTISTTDMYLNNAYLVTKSMSMGTDISNNIIVLSLPLTTYKSGKIIIESTHTNGTQLSEMFFIHDNVNSYDTSSLLYSNTQLFICSTNLVGNNINILIKQNFTNQNIKLFGTLIK